MRHNHRLLTRQQAHLTPSFGFSPEDITTMLRLFDDLRELANRIPNDARHLLENMSDDGTLPMLDALQIEFAMCEQYEHTTYLPLEQDDTLRLLQVFVLLGQDMRAVTDFRRQYSVGESGLSNRNAELYMRLRHFAYGSSHTPAHFTHDFLAEIRDIAATCPSYTDTWLVARILEDMPVSDGGSLDRLFFEDVIRLAAHVESGKHPSDLLEQDLYPVLHVPGISEPRAYWSSYVLSTCTQHVIDYANDLGATESTFLKESDPSPTYRTSRFAVFPDVYDVPNTPEQED